MLQSRTYKHMRCAFFALCIMKSGLCFTVHNMECYTFIFNLFSSLQTLTLLLDSSQRKLVDNYVDKFHTDI